MPSSFVDRLKHAWNAFATRDPPSTALGYSSSLPPTRPMLSLTSEKSIVSSIYNRIAIDVAAVDLHHVRLDANGRYVETLDSGLEKCLSLEPNIDQTARAFIRDLVLSMFDEGVVAAVPYEIDRKSGLDTYNAYDILAMRTGQVLEWFPRHVRVRLYDDRDGQRKDILLPKSDVALIENPLYAVMNEPNSTLKRLVRKLAILDAIDEQSGSGKLDIIIQLPYVIKNETRRQQAEMRRQDIEKQLAGSKYGIAYIDGTERVTQLNRAAENNLLNQITYLTDMLYNQLGLTPDVFNGTADEKAMLNYYNRTIEPILSEIVESMKKTFLTKTARTKGQSIKYFRDPFKLVPVEQIADIADKFTRNEILSSNEVRAIIGYKPVDDPAADELRNKNLNKQEDTAPPPTTAEQRDPENSTEGE